MKAKAAVVAVLSLAMATMALSCLRHAGKTKIEFGKITQGDRIEWSVSFGETRVPTYQGGKEPQAIIEEMGEAPFLITLSASSEEDVWVGDHSGKVYHFDGLTWSGVGSLDAWINCIYASDPNHVWVGAEETAVDEQGKREETGRGVILFYDGQKWSQQLVFEEREEGHGIVGIEGVGPDDMWAIDNYALFHYDGRQWRTTYAKGDGSKFDQEHPGLVLERLLVGEDGIPVIHTSEGFFYYRDEAWTALPELPCGNVSFNCRGLAGSLSDGFWASGPTSEGSTAEMPSKVMGIVYRYHEGRWQTAYKNDEGLIGSCAAVTSNTVVVAGNRSKEVAYEIDMKVAVMLYFDGSSWSEQGSIEGGAIWDIDMVDEDTIWLTDGERVIKGEIKK